MGEEYRAYWFFIIVMIFYMLMSIIRLIKEKFILINKKLDAVIKSTSVNYPTMDDISEKAKKAVKMGDRNKAIRIIKKECLCTETQAETIIKEIEQKIIFPHTD